MFLLLPRFLCEGEHDDVQDTTVFKILNFIHATLKCQNWMASLIESLHANGYLMSSPAEIIMLDDTEFGGKVEFCEGRKTGESSESN